MLESWNSSIGFCFASPWNEGQAKIRGTGSKTSLLLRSRLPCLLLPTGWAQLSLVTRRQGKNKQPGRRVFISEVRALQGQKWKTKWDTLSSMAGFWYLTDIHQRNLKKRACSWHGNKEHNKDFKPKETGDRVGEVWGSLRLFFFLFFHVSHMVLSFSFADKLRAGVLDCCLKICIYLKIVWLTWSIRGLFFFCL